ncbi:SDR family NAD(P)-dependent oxidoreductase [Actinomadura macrotermitis]|uniref:3-oxoacyl-[acyl-carrier-protein] reductase FabG n=1 Tax=Actinomadura macrotermitis TaxID=2585200 RepID=A0A7K0BRI1_9ACTN|nr:glucose 1-dehydrogenase [Actinomadura macrotermitis]MQY03800.1 3-oxoacyl-[acyl-carrier-protein] reductase FabG [Actinomadura macrotermitis]
MGTLENKSALVTGGSRGIGRAIVVRLAREGAAVVFSFVRDQAAAEDVVAEVAAFGGRAIAVRADQGRLEDLTHLFGEVDRNLAGLDVVVNNAAINPMGNICDATESDFDEVMAVNTKGPFFVVQAAAERLGAGGRIINISSSGAVPGLALYFASKAALESITAVAAHEFGPRGITVNSVTPGATETDMMRAAAGEHLEQAIEHTVSLTPLQRLGRPEDIANVVAFLAGPDAQWITGQNLRVSGGLTI